MDNPRIKIFVAHHKPWYIYEDDVYVPIQVWKRNSDLDLWILWDDIWDNISEKNNNYAELTAQYWVRKNYDLSDVDYVWFCHYRRYMTYYYSPNLIGYIFAKNFYSSIEHTNRFTRRIKSLREKNYLSTFDEKKLNKNSVKIRDFIKNNSFDVYTPYKDIFIKWKLLSKLWIDHKSTSWSRNEWEIEREAWKLLVEMYPEQKEIIKDVENEWKEYYMLHRHMFIMRKELFIQYAKRMFDYLFALERKIQEKHLDTSHHFSWDKRFIWMFSEPLITYRLAYMKRKNNIKVSSKSNTIMFTDFYI